MCLVWTAVSVGKWWYLLNDRCAMLWMAVSWKVTVPVEWLLCHVVVDSWVLAVTGTWRCCHMLAWQAMPLSWWGRCSKTSVLHLLTKGRAISNFYVLCFVWVFFVLFCYWHLLCLFCFCETLCLMFLYVCFVLYICVQTISVHLTWV